MNAVEQINAIKEAAKRNANRPAEHKLREVWPEKINEGECFRQGDLYLWRVADDFPVGAEVRRDQIADGVSLGARHVLRGTFRVYVGTTPPPGLNPVHARACVGYAVDVEAGTVLTHPEHDHYKFMRSGRWQVTHQLDLQTLRRAAD